MKILIVIVVLAMGLLFTMISPRTVSDKLTLTPSKGNADGKSCLGKERCLLVYVAPWCPYCHTSIPAIQTVINEWKNTPNRGISVIIGRDSDEKLEAMAQKLNSVNTFVDANGSVWRKLELRAVPHWLWLDSSNKVLHTIPGAVNSGTTLINELNKY